MRAEGGLDRRAVITLVGTRLLGYLAGREMIDRVRAQGIVIRSHSTRGVAEEAPGAYKDVGAVVAAAERAGRARRVARLRPLISIKG
jgi:tRNA-splicing ligase RtcB